MKMVEDFIVAKLKSMGVKHASNCHCEALDKARDKFEAQLQRMMSGSMPAMGGKHTKAHRKVSKKQHEHHQAVKHLMKQYNMTLPEASKALKMLRHKSH